MWDRLLIALGLKKKPAPRPSLIQPDVEWPRSIMGGHWRPNRPLTPLPDRDPGQFAERASDFAPGLPKNVHYVRAVHQPPRHTYDARRPVASTQADSTQDMMLGQQLAAGFDSADLRGEPEPSSAPCPAYEAPPPSPSYSSEGSSCSSGYSSGSDSGSSSSYSSD